LIKTTEGSIAKQPFFRLLLDFGSPVKNDLNLLGLILPLKYPPAYLNFAHRANKFDGLTKKRVMQEYE
jgi:hypothetical protein